MMNILKIDGHKAIIKYDPEIDRFRGEFLDLNGGADFYAGNIEELKKEGRISLKTYFDICREEGIQPYKEYSGRFNLRVPPDLHAAIALRAASEGKSLNQFVIDLLGETIQRGNAPTE